MQKKIEVHLDNGGNITLQTKDFAVCYERESTAKEAVQCADDIRAFLTSGDTSDWDGNTPEVRQSSPCDLDRDDIETLIAAGRIIKRVGTGYAGAALICELMGWDALRPLSEYVESN